VRACLPLGMAVILGGTRVVFRNDALVLGQHIHSKTFLGMQVSVGAGTMVHANQNQRWIERNGAKGVGRHAVYCAFVVHRNYRHPRRKTAQRIAEFFLSDGHLKVGALPFRGVRAKEAISHVALKSFTTKLGGLNNSTLCERVEQAFRPAYTLVSCVGFRPLRYLWG